MDKHTFTYRDESIQAFTGKNGKCDCCERIVDSYHISHSEWWAGWNFYLNPKSKPWRKGLFRKAPKYSPEDYELHLCRECIASGDAAKKFGVKLNWVVNPSDECTAIGYDEVVYRTPCYNAAKEPWPVHCNGACVYTDCYAVDMDRMCHEFTCGQCGEIIKVMI